MTQGKICPICKKWFIPNKYRPNKQAVCSNIECQYERQLQNMEIWRKRNPEYFDYRQAKDSSWKHTCRERALDWRKRHTEYLHLYRQQHKEEHRSYMREYMREWRKKKKKNKEI